MRALLAALAALSVTGCGATTVELIRVPQSLTVPCQAPTLGGDTNGALATLAIEQRYALAECSGRMNIIGDIYGTQTLSSE